MGVSAQHNEPTRAFGAQARETLLDELAAELGTLRTDIALLVQAPTNVKLREALVGKLRAWSGRATAAEELQLAEDLRTCQLVLSATALLGELDERDSKELAQALERVDAATASEQEREMTPTSGPVPSVALRPRKSLYGVLRAIVVGRWDVAQGLVAEDWATEDENSPAFEIDHVADATQAKPVIAERKPEVVIVDSALAGARRLVERLLADRATESIPVVVLGEWADPEHAAGYLALGVARCLEKPVTPGVLRRACLEVAPQWHGTSFEPLGETRLDALSLRLAQELHRGLCDAVSHDARGELVDLGDGADVLATMWSAVARIRELVTAKSAGRLRFEPGGPVPTLPRAAWLTAGRRRASSDREPALQEVRRVGDERSLSGYRVLIADDDPSANWFASGVLKEAGATVYEAFDGEQALDHAYRMLPDIVLADIVMPELDGYALCRAFKRDVVLRSVPVILMSWKEDLLQRMRELGAQADGYLRKDTAGEEMLRRVNELLRSQRSVAMRIARTGVVRGRLDGITPYSLLKLTCRIRPNARVTVRDAHFGYEIELRGGRPVCATRTSATGSSERGAHVIARLLGVGAGRFTVEPVDADVAAPLELEGGLDDQLRQPIALARATQGLLTGSPLTRVARVHLDETALAMPLSSTPEPSRGVLRALNAGTSPRTLIHTGRASAELVERVLCDVARYGAVDAVIGHSGAELLGDAFERELAIVQGHYTRRTLRPKIAEQPPPTDVEPLGVDDPSAELQDDAEPRERAEQPRDAELQYDAEPPCDAEPHVAQQPPSEAVDFAAPSDANEPVPAPTPMAESMLPHRMSWVGDTPRAGGAALAHATPVLASVEVSEEERRNTPIFAVPVDREPRLAELERAERPQRRAESKRVRADDSARSDDEAGDEPVVKRAKDDAPRADMTTHPDSPSELAPFTSPHTVLPSSYAPRFSPATPEKAGARWVVPMVFGVIGITLAIGARWWREHAPAAPVATPAPAVGPAESMPPEPTLPVARARPAAGSAKGGALPLDTADDATDDAADEEAELVAEKPVELALSEEDRAKLEEDHGLIELVVGRSDVVYVDGKRIGKGPVAVVAVLANDQPHEVRVKMRGEERVRYVKAVAGKRVRLRVAPPWSR